MVGLLHSDAVPGSARGYIYRHPQLARCSTRSLIREGIRREIEKLINEMPDKIIPVSLDGDWKHPGFMVMPTKSQRAWYARHP